MTLTQCVCETDSFVSPGRRHPDVGQDHVEMLSLDRCHELVVVGTGRDHLEIRRGGHEAREALSYEQIVLAHGNPQRHGATIIRSHHRRHRAYMPEEGMPSARW